ncbi:MAG: carboxypeptidase regulatory-like domain-containing protein [Cyanobacteria bacterium NC_groundwater_1444_Ag_S-0.65um_54_12]|nr:carboxypeptidase regulatory-like domain-containing protein [Cyanobacteria bacterium NC_groundwater_1444_Ag_S-0.65um_54_12]
MTRPMAKQIAKLALVAVFLALGCGRQATPAIPWDGYGGDGSGSFSPPQSLPTGTITGRVVDAKTGLGIADVRIEVQGVSPALTAQTDGSGNYMLNAVPAMRVKLLLEKVGYSYLQGNGDVIVQVLPGNTVTAPDIKLSAQLDAVPNAFLLSIGNLDRPRALTLDPGGDGDSKRPAGLLVITRENFQLFGSIQTPIRVWGVRRFNLAGGLENRFGATFLIHDLQNPEGIAADLGGDVYVTDTGSNVIRAYSSFGTYIKPTENAQSFPGINKPYDIQVLRTGQFAVSSAGNNQILLFDTAKGPAHDARGNLLKPITGSTGLKGLTVDADDNLYFIDDAASAGGVIKKVSIAGTLLLQFGYRGGRGPGYFEHPTDLAVDNRNGDIYVVDAGNNRIQRFNRDGAFLSEFGGMGAGNGQFNNPVGIAVDREGFVFVSDSNNNRIQKFAPARLAQAGY